MPELPEAQVIVNELTPVLVGRRIIRVQACDEKFARQLEKFKIFRPVRGSEIQKVKRRGKAIVLDLSGGFSLLIQLGMTGGLLFFPGGGYPSHVRYWLGLSGGSKLLFRDTRKFGKIAGYRRGEPENRPAFLKTLGPDPLSSDFHSRYLRERGKNRILSIKEFLMNQTVVAGIGNIYSSEILFAAGVDPRQPTRSLDSPAWERIVRQTRMILRRAIDAGGTTIRDYRRTDDQQGTFSSALMVYGREQQSCVRCRSVIRKIRQGNRSTFFCPGCQRLLPFRD
jgi:formamidopyrimidine-DNA glycosylase